MGHHHHHHHADYGESDGDGRITRVLLTALVFTLAFAAVEAVVGWWAGSLALMSDAAHMVTDSAALAIGAFAAWLATRPPSSSHSYGLWRAEVLGALVNALFMVVLVASIVIAAVDRLQAPIEVRGSAVLGVAAVGLVVNIVVAWVLHRGEQTLNVRGAMLHVMGDLLGSVAAIAAGGIILLTGWTPIDPILSLLIAALIAISAWRLLGEVVHVLMEGVPRGMALEEIGTELAAIDGVREVHDLHVWSLGSRQPALSAHLVVDDLDRWPVLLAVARELLQERFAIAHCTLQPELEEQVALVPVERLSG